MSGYSSEKIKDFYLSNYKNDGSLDWEVKGDEALIHEKYVDIDRMDAKYYAQDDVILVKSKTAKLNKENMDVALKEDVHIENQEGITLDTDSLDWQRSKSQLDTDDWVEIKKEGMQVKAKGLSADTELKNVDFQENVQAQMPNKNGEVPTVITCDGPLDVEYNSGKAVFNNNVKVEHPDGTLFSDKATVFFDTQEKDINKIVSQGNVKIIKDENVTFAEKATYFRREGKIVLEGRPRLVYFPKKGEKVF
ncbi:MAG: LPS export ABC transporter periplasmic protein LptC [Candidatus Omnitrophica bacterium]|nr:LPS export ABC transporter periplasmic protein LptC [Candidatus Omnitrophota bacterium]